MKLFDLVQFRRPRRNKFDLSHEKKFSFNPGNLVPIMVQEVLPGDSFRVTSELFLRMMPMVAPVMHRVDVFTHYFFVPNRLIWNEWEDFITGGKDGTAAPVHPFVQYTNANKVDFVPSSLLDYMGYPIREDNPGANVFKMSVLPLRAYQLIYDQYYRDQNLQDSLDIDMSSGDFTGTAEWDKLKTMRKRCWEKDYRTSCLPFAQRGPAVDIPLSGEGSVTYLDQSKVVQEAGGIAAANVLASVGGPDPQNLITDLGGGNNPVRIENIDTVNLDSSGVTINDLRRSVRLQEWLEKNARGGARYIEQILAHFGIISSDARLQRPEYLGGGKQPVTISEVLSTYSPDSSTPPQGNMSGHGISAGRTNGFKRTFEEHGYVIGLVSVLPKTAYQQGLERGLTRFDKFDYFWPEFANLGEQEVKRSEINFLPATSTMNQTFGYQSRYAEYKYMNSTVHGNLREQLAFWHWGRILDSSTPLLNEAFVACDPDMRIFADTDPNADHLVCQCYHRVDALRPMPIFGTPTL